MVTLVWPLSAKVATDRLLEGVARLASGEPVGVVELVRRLVAGH